MKVIFELVASDTNVAIELQKQRDLVRQLNKEYKASTAPEDQKRLIGELAKAKVAIGDLTKQQKALNNEFKSTQVPTDSIAGMRLEISRLTAEYVSLTAAQRNSEFGVNLQKNILATTEKVKGLEANLGNFTRNVGNYRKAFASIGDLLTGGLITGGAVVAFEKLIQVMQLGIDVAVEYEKALDDLSALTGLTGGDLTALENVGKGLQEIDINGQKVISTGTDVLNALKLVGGAQPELLKDADALGQVTEQAIILSKASGDDLEPSVNALTTVLGQFDLAAGESARVINELAAGAKEGSSEIPQTTDALQKFGTIAKTVNVSTGESVALIELLADRQLKGAEAGTQLRNVLVKIASADSLPKKAQEAFKELGIDVNVLKDSTIPLEQRLRELGKAQGDVTALTEIFGNENLQAATIITDGLGRYVELTEKVQGTSEAYTQAAIRSDNASTSFQNLKNKAVNELQDRFSTLTPALSSVADFFGRVSDNVGLVDIAFAQLTGGATLVRRLFKSLGLVSDETSDKVATVKESVDLLFNQPGGGDQLAPFLNKKAEAATELKKAFEEAGGKDPEKGLGKIKKEAPLVAGSLDFLQKKVADLKSELESSKPDQIPRILGNLTEAENQLKALENQVEILKNKAIGQNDKSTEPLSLIPTPETAEQLQQQSDDGRLRAIKKFQEQVTKDDEKARAERTKEELEAETEKEESKKLIRGAALDALANGISAIAESQNAKIEEEKNERIAAIDDEYQKRKDAAAGNAVELAKIDKEYEAKKAQIEKDAAKERQRIAIVESLIAGALAVVKALPNIPLAIATGIAAATQTAIIATKKFAVGGFTGKGSRSDETGERMVNAQLHEDEYVAPRAQVQQYPHLFKWLDRNRPKRGASTGVGYAVGGFSAAPAVTFSTAQAQTNQAISLTAEAVISPNSAQVLADTVAKQVYSAIAAGLNDADRTNERKAKLEDFTNV